MGGGSDGVASGGLVMGSGDVGIAEEKPDDDGCPSCARRRLTKTTSPSIQFLGKRAS